jgi:hypothetical protein
MSDLPDYFSQFALRAWDRFWIDGFIYCLIVTLEFCLYSVRRNVEIDGGYGRSDRKLENDS